MSLFRRKKAAVDSGPKTYSAQGKRIVCPHCGLDQFDRGHSLLNTPGMTFLGIEWANRKATFLSCRHCGRIEWFLHAPQAEGQ